MSTETYFSNYFRGNDEASHKRMLSMHQELIGCEFQSTPCPLLASQIEEAIVFARRFIKHGNALLAGLKDQA